MFLSALINNTIALFQPINQNQLESVDSFHDFHLITTVYTKECPSLAHRKLSSCLSSVLDKNSYICKGIEKCQHFHNKGSQRRPVFGPDEVLSYLPVPCQGGLPIKDLGIRDCKSGDKCLYAHTQNEIVYHPLVYRTIKCEDKDCLKDFCPSYHNTSDCRTVLSLLNSPKPQQLISPLPTAVPNQPQSKDASPQ